MKEETGRVSGPLHPSSFILDPSSFRKNLVVIPAYNEEASLPRAVDSLQALPDGYEILIVNDGSQDGTGRVADGLARSSRRPVHVVHLPLNSGIGVAVQTGYLFAARRGEYRYVLQFDADGQHDAADLPALVRACEGQGLDLCIGSRFLAPGGGFRSTWPRRVGIRFFARLIGLLSGLRVTDPTSGLRCAGPRAWACFAAPGSLRSRPVGQEHCRRVVGKDSSGSSWRCAAALPGSDPAGGRFELP